MSVDLLELVDPLKREVNLPGSELFPNARDGDYEGYLTDAFWELAIVGVISGYTEDEGIVTSDSGGDDLSRPLQQLIVLSAGIKIIRNKMIEIDTVFRSKAGPVEFETQKAASVLKAVLDALRDRYNDIIDGLPSSNSGPSIGYIDPIVERTTGFYANDTGQFVGY